MEYDDYFAYRRVDPSDYDTFEVPFYLLKALGHPAGKRVLDFGCGFGQMAIALKRKNYEVEGLDISQAAILHCRNLGLLCHEGADASFYENFRGLYDFVLMSHVVEHFPKDQIIETLSKVRDLLVPSGAVIVMVPNAQSNTGAYWAYEDFTHETLFTTGSLYYVLRAAGFSTVDFLDPDVTEGMALHRKAVKKIFLALYRFNYRFWNRITSSATHAPSPHVFSYEIKALARP